MLTFFICLSALMGILVVWLAMGRACDGHDIEGLEANLADYRASLSSEHKRYSGLWAELLSVRRECATLKRSRDYWQNLAFERAPESTSRRDAIVGSVVDIEFPAGAAEVVGEPPFDIIINCTKKTSAQRSLTYMDVVGMAGYAGLPTVVYYKAMGPKEEGILGIGGSVAVKNGTVFCVAHTGNA